MVESTMQQGLNIWVKSECVNTYNALRGIRRTLNSAANLSESLNHTSEASFINHISSALKIEIDRLPIMRSISPDIVDAVHNAISLASDRGSMNAILDRATVAAIAECQCGKPTDIFSSQSEK